MSNNFSQLTPALISYKFFLMLLDKLISAPTDFPHIISALQHSHEIILNTETSLFIFCPVSKVYIAEYSGNDLENFINEIECRNIIRLQTTNKNLFEKLKSRFAVSYECVQAIYPDKNYPEENMNSVLEEDLPFAAETYGLESYIFQLHNKKRLFALYEENTIAGYVAYHIDESVGALYVKPEFRKKGYGAKLMEAAFKNYKDGIRYSQIVSDNTASIKLHKKIGCKISERPLYWVYDEDYFYEE